MRGWQFTKVGEPLQLVELPDPHAKSNEIVIDVKAAGLCRTDLGFMSGVTTDSLAFTPIILGHEFAGVVSEVGDQVTDFKVGDRVACRAGADSPGVLMNGAYATKTVAPATLCAKVPNDVAWMEAASATDAALTAYHAVIKQAAVTATDKVAIIGLGGLGFNAAQIALTTGAEVYAVTRKDSVLAKIKALGVPHVAHKITELADQGINKVIDFVGVSDTITGAIKTLVPHGTLTEVGLGSLKADFRVYDFVVKELNMNASVGGTVADLKAVFKLLQTRQLQLDTTPITFDEIPDGLAQLKAGKVTGRQVALID